jgi:hypothetical protein
VGIEMLKKETSSVLRRSEGGLNVGDKVYDERGCSAELPNVSDKAYEKRWQHTAYTKTTTIEPRQGWKERKQYGR